MSVLILKNISGEGSGTIEDFFKENRISSVTIELEKEAIPDAKGFDILVMMGGPMSVNDDIPYIRKEEGLTREFISRGKKVFGVCLGAQIMAKALGAKVYVGPQKEIGWYDIELTEEGTKDPLMRKLAESPGTKQTGKAVKVFQWHGETFDLPVGAVRIAKSELYPNQAFRYGDNAYAFQFHIEVRKEMIYDWLRDEPVDMGRIRSQTESLYEEYQNRAINFFKAFFKNGR